MPRICQLPYSNDNAQRKQQKPFKTRSLENVEENKHVIKNTKKREKKDKFLRCKLLS